MTLLRMSRNRANKIRRSANYENLDSSRFRAFSGPLRCARRHGRPQFVAEQSVRQIEEGLLADGLPESDLCFWHQLHMDQAYG